VSDQQPVDSPVGWVKEHIADYERSGGEEGRDGHLWRGAPTLLLTMTGRRTRTRRRTALIYGEDGDSYVVVASKGGAPKHPAWFLNLQADPDVEIQVGPRTLSARARVAEPDEKARLWPMMTRIWPAYDAYQKKTDRDIPVVVLDPVQ
jgi:deazaflavin-dependent oxidoreductase (nitroreductase family)